MAQTLFWSVGKLFLRAVNISITTSWMILAVLFIRFVLKKGPKWISVLLWGTVALRLIMPFSIESVFSLVPSTQTFPVSSIYSSDPLIANNTYYFQINSGISVIDQNSYVLQDISTGATIRSNLSILGGIWLIGSAFLLIYAFISYLKIRRKLGEAIPYQDNIWLCDQVESPFIFGIFRPRIYLPSSLDETEREYVLAHERAHLKRKDQLWKPFGFLLLALYWFHPLMWIAYILLCRDIEMACDEKVIADMEMSEKKAYANALVSCSLQRRLALACPLAFGEIGVKERVKGVLNYRKPALWVIFAAGVVCVVVAVCFLTSPKYEEQDLSFLNYKSAVSLIAQNGVDYVINCPAVVSVIQVGGADDREVAQYLEACDWRQKRFPPQSLSSPGSVTFVIEEHYRITVYQKPRIACVHFEGQNRYYNIGSEDYKSALVLFHAMNPSDFQG